MLTDIRDFVANIVNFEPTDLSWWGELCFSLIAFVPLVGALKYADEVVEVVKYSDEAVGAVKHLDDTVGLAKYSDETAGAAKHLDEVIEGGSYASPNKVDSLLDGRPELTGSTRDKLLATVQDPELSKIVNELYRPGATVGDGGTAAILVEEFSKGSSTHLLKATERLKQLKKLASSGKLGLNDLDVVEALIDDLESAISLYN